MEIVTAQMLAGALSKALDAAGGEAGRRSVAVLARIVGKWKSRSGSEAGEAVPALDDPLKPEQIPGLARALAAAAAADPVLAGELADWHRGTVVTVTGAGDVSASVSGTVDGNVVQARDVTGGITFN